jgi:hypothetical protein
VAVPLLHPVRKPPSRRPAAEEEIEVQLGLANDRDRQEARPDRVGRADLPEVQVVEKEAADDEQEADGKPRDRGI